MLYGIRSANARHSVKLRQNRSNVYGDVAILRFFKLVAAILDFQKFKFLTANPLERPNLRHLLNCIKIGRFVAEIWRFFDFSRWRPFAILDTEKCDY